MKKAILFTLITIFYFSSRMAQQYETQQFEVIKTDDFGKIVL